jgi:hypothetical protein
MKQSAIFWVQIMSVICIGSCLSNVVRAVKCVLFCTLTVRPTVTSTMPLYGLQMSEIFCTLKIFFSYMVTH